MAQRLVSADSVSNDLHATKLLLRVLGDLDTDRPLHFYSDHTQELQHWGTAAAAIARCVGFPESVHNNAALSLFLGATSVDEAIAALDLLRPALAPQLDTLEWVACS